MCLLLIVTTALLTEVFTANLFFQTVQDNVVIDGIEPFFNEHVDNRLECYAVCQRTPDKCLFVEVSKLQGDVWSCKLFEFASGSIKDHLKAALPGTTTTVATPTLKRDCLELLNNGFNKDGVYYIGFTGSARKVYCDMTTQGGGWIVMQKRLDGSVDFYRDWKTFKNGFGDAYGEYWLGNDFVHQYTNSHPTEMLAEATAFDDVRVVAMLKGFKLGDEAVSQYTLQFGSCITLTTVTTDLCIDWEDANNVKFSTFDVDNDRLSMNCANVFGGAWWHVDCFRVNLNGRYSSVPTVIARAKNIHWRQFRDVYESLK
ncbi:MAG: fibrinogen-related domain-containing protein, partial [Cyanobacteria bacterium J06649_11]